MLYLIDPARDGGTVTAQGYISQEPVRKGRVFTTGGNRYRLGAALESTAGGVRCIGLNLKTPVILEVLDGT